MNKKNTIIFGIMFSVILLSGLVINIIIPDKSFSSEENRMLQKLPEFTAASYKEGRFERKMDNYANDQFPFRNKLIKIKTAFDQTIGKTESNNVFLCDDHYLMEDISAPDKDKMDANIKALEKFKSKYPNFNISFLLAPNAANIYKDKLPVAKTIVDQNEVIDNFYNKLDDIGIQSIDIRDSFEKNKDKIQLYYRTDHHWTSDGAYLAFDSISKSMKLKDEVKYKPLTVKSDFRGTLASKSGFTNGLNDSIKIYLPKKDSRFENSIIYYSDTKEKLTNFYQLDNLKTKDAYTVFGGSNHPIYTISTPIESERRLLLIKDSYANSVIPFLSQCFREIVIIDPRYFFDDINEVIESKGITDVLFLYNANTYVSDNSLEMTLIQ